MKLFAALVLFLAYLVPARADTTTPTFEEVLPELALIGNDVTFQNVTPATLQAVINAEIAAEFPGGYMTTSPEYEAQFFADGSAFLFQVPEGTTVGGSSIGTADPVPEPSTWLLLAVGLVLILMRPQIGEYSRGASRYGNAYTPRKWAA